MTPSADAIGWSLNSKDTISLAYVQCSSNEVIAVTDCFVAMQPVLSLTTTALQHRVESGECGTLQTGNLSIPVILPLRTN